MRSLWILLAALAATAPAAAGGDFYVDAVLGKNNSSAGTQAQPWKTISYAVFKADELSGGAPCTIHVAPGTYDPALGEVFPIHMRPGISVAGAGPEGTLVRGTGTELLFLFPSSSGPFSSVSFDASTRLESMRFENAHTAVRCFSKGGIANPTLADLEFDGLVRGVYLETPLGQGDEAAPTLLGCRFLSCGTGVGGLLHGFPLGTVAIRDSEFLGCGKGIDVVIAGVVVTELVIQVERSEFRGCGVGIEVYSIETVFTRVRLFDSLVAGGGDGLLGGTFGGSLQATVERSTIAGNDRGVASFMLGYSVNLRDSIVWGNVQDFDPPAGEILAFYTLASSNVGDWPIALPPGNLQVDPQFVDAIAGDYHLGPGSPLIDAGDPAHPPGGVDRDGDPRLLDGDADAAARRDMGYDEHNRVRLDLSGSLQPGGAVALAVDAPAGWLYFQAFSTGTADLDQGAVGSLLLDPASLVFFDQGTAPAVFPIVLPSDPAVSGLQLFLQAAGFEPGGPAGSVSNRVAAAIG